MNQESIQTLIENYINQSIEGLDLENPKLEFKRKWLNLNDDIHRNEFLKDVTAMANTVGLDGFIIFGFDDNTKELEDATFSDCGLKDTSHLNGLINRHVDRLFTINTYDIKVQGKSLSVLHIPPSFDKPHVIRNYKSKGAKDEIHRVFVRKGTEVKIASKYDYDFMYYDRKNLTPEYRIHLSSYYDGWEIFPVKDNKVETQVEIKLLLNLNIENTGLRPVAINQIDIMVPFHFSETIEFISLKNNGKWLKSTNITIQPGEINNFDFLVFESTTLHPREDIEYIKDHKYVSKDIFAKVYLSSGKVFETKIEEIPSY